MAQLIDIHTHQIEQNPQIRSIFNVRLPNRSPVPSTIHSVGWHPWDVEKLDVMKARQQFLDAVHDAEVVAIGECGLDRACRVPIEKQIPFFEFQVEHAKSLKLPLVIHCVKAYSEVLGILMRLKFENAVIFHAYRGNGYETKELLKLNAYFSIGIRKGHLNTSTLACIPFERLFLETDDSEQRIETVYSLVSKKMNWNLRGLEEQIFNNYKQVFENGLA
jgi:TatD DNase family protein